MIPVLLVLLLVIALPKAGWTQDKPQDLSSLSLEELAAIETTTSTRTPTPLSNVAAAVFVITQEDIRRSGVTSVPDALRLAPGVQVARIDADKWAIGLRGFGSRLSRAMLVMIDGRAVYTPLFAGTYWQVQDTLLDDIDRIEVVLGPGGTLWGANAVNGIVNIITKAARESQGTLLAAGGGSEERGAVRVRYGGKIGEQSFYRMYGKFFNRDPLFHADGSNFDGWRMGQAGFRADRTVHRDKTLTLQGDAYGGTAGQRSSLTTLTPLSSRVIQGDADASGGNVLGRWGGPVGRSDVRLQAFYDHTNRRELTFQEQRDTVDVDFQHRPPRLAGHRLLWGAGYRVSSGDFRGSETLTFVPNRRTDQLVTWFLEDDVEAVPARVHVIVGSKFEHNGYSGFEAQPGGRVLWTPTPRQTVVGSITRAVRTPSRVEHDLAATSLVSPAPLTLSRFTPNEQFQSERLLAYEMQYRVQPTKALSLFLSTFLNHYDDLLSIETGAPFLESSPSPPHIAIPIVLGNGLHGESYGLEMTSIVDLAGWWRLTGEYSLVRIDLTADAGSRDTSTAPSTEGSSPRHVEWPSGQRWGSDTFDICVLGEDSVGAPLEEIVKGKVIDGHQLAAKQILGPLESRDCRILFVSPSEDRRVPAILQALEGTGTVTVSRGTEFTRLGGMIAFTTDDRKVRFVVNLVAAETAKLKLSSQLLRVAVSVEQ